MSILNKIFSKGEGIDERFLRKNKSLLEEISALEPELQKLSDISLRERSLALRETAKETGDLDKILPEGFALVREASKRVLSQRHYDVQILAGLAMHQGKIVEMKTGEGKTLSATAPSYLNALLGKGVHVITVNDYLAKRDAVWMGQIHYALGLSVSCLVQNQAFLYDPDYGDNSNVSRDEERDKEGFYKIEQSYLRPVSRKEGYQADITYGTNHEFGFDYLRDNLAYDLNNKVQRGHSFVIIDEVDSILIDEARTPLIITVPETASSEYYKTFSKIAPQLKRDEDYEVDEKYKAISINESGISKVEKILGIDNLYDPEGFRYLHYLEESLKAHALFRRDKNYVVKNGEIIIVDEFTGRLLAGRRYSGGLHQAIEAKEGVAVKEENRVLASITFQNYFRLYEKLSGMTGTALTSAEEFDKVYRVEVVSIPTNKPNVRQDLPDLIYKTDNEKWQAIIKTIRDKNTTGQPILVGTVSIEKNEKLSALLNKEGITHEILNAKNHEREANIIARAGETRAVTVATNMAGRGVDIVLGGIKSSPEEAQKIKDLGGLFVIGTERHEARRTDNQLRGRAGRQGDPGQTQFFLSLEDDLMTIFGGEKMKKMMETLRFPDGEPIQTGFISKGIESAQSRVEGMHFDSRKYTLEYDDVLNKHRTSFYQKRNEILQSKELDNFTSEIIENKLGQLVELEEENIKKEMSNLADILGPTENYPNLLDSSALFGFLKQKSDMALEKIKSELGDNIFQMSIRQGALRLYDSLWTEHLENMDHLRDSVRLRAYGQHDPLVEYKSGGHRLFKDFFERFDSIFFEGIFKMKKPEMSMSRSTSTPPMRVATNNETNSAPIKATANKVGRNDPCPCGSGKKYKKCCGV